MNTPFRLRLALTAALALATASALAAPKDDHGQGGRPNDRNPPMEHGQSGKNPHGQPGNGGHAPSNGAHGQAEGRDHGYRAQGADDDDRDSLRIQVRAPQVNLIDVRGILVGHRDLLYPTDSLPPGIRQNVARGKPLPPGIAKNIDPRLSGRLPHYDGYEWKQVGRDIVLVAIATGIVYEVLDHIFD